VHHDTTELVYTSHDVTGFAVPNFEQCTLLHRRFIRWWQNIFGAGRVRWPPPLNAAFASTSVKC
jgi:hypothetical protein